MTPVVSFARQRQSWLSYTVTAQGTYGGEAEPKRIKKYAKIKPWEDHNAIFTKFSIWLVPQNERSWIDYIELNETALG